VSRAGSILVVCTGNVCRSPYLERRLRHELAATGIAVESAGTKALAGLEMDDGTRERLDAAGIDATAFQARQLSADLVARADLVLAAAREHRTAVAQLHPAALRRVFTVRDFADLVGGLTAVDLESDPLGDRDASWVRHVAAAGARRRGSIVARQSGVDITDPIGGPPSDFRQMAQEIDAALVPIVRALRDLPVPPLSE
jgi:protein-tyrosine phosphatase